MIDFLVASTICSGLAIGLFGYIYWKCGKLATLSVMILAIIEYGYAFIGKYTNYFIPLEVAIVLWNIYIIAECRDRNVLIVVLITIILYILKRMFLADTLIVGSGALCFAPLTLYWLYKCCLPKQRKYHEKIWG